MQPVAAQYAQDHPHRRKAHLWSKDSFEVLAMQQPCLQRALYQY